MRRLPLKPSSFLDLVTLRLRASWTRSRQKKAMRQLKRERRREELLLRMLQDQHQRMLQALQRAEELANPPLLMEPEPEIEPEPQWQEPTAPPRLTPGTPLDPEPMLPPEEMPEPAVDQISRMLASPSSPPSTSQV